MDSQNAKTDSEMSIETTMQDLRKRVITPSESLEDLLCFGESSGENSVLQNASCDDPIGDVETHARPLDSLAVLDSSEFTRCESFRRNLGISR